MRASPRPSPALLGELVCDDERVSTLPLGHVEVQGQIVGMLVSVALTQHFANPFTAPIELAYRFAIPHRASLAGFAIRVGDRSIEGEIASREDALELYQEAVRDGRRAALTTEERPNLYTVRIGNVQPGEAIVATYRYSLHLEFDGGQFEAVLPFGITPRYHRADEAPAEAAATDVTIAPSGAPVADLDVTLAIDAGVAIQDPDSPSHQIETTRLDERRCVVRLVAPRVPNKDFVLRYRVRNEDGQVLAASWRAIAKEGDLLYAVFVPPAPDETDVAATPREYVFVLDRSGSMSGSPVAQARNALRAALRTLTDADTFRILLFDNEVQWYEPSRSHALPFTDRAVSAADAFLAEVEGRGGTELLPALQAVIDLPADVRRQRVVVLLTDGAISAEEETARLVSTLPRRDRLFCFGIGPSVNRYLLDRLARAGRGVAEVVGLDEDIEGAIIRFQDRLSYPVLADLRLDASGSSLTQVYPSPLPDLYAGQTLHVVARLDGASNSGEVGLKLRGRRGETEVVLSIATTGSRDEPMIRRLWAQQRIDALLESPGEQRRETIIALSRAYQVLTPYTALLAIDRVAVGTGQQPRKILVASPLPEDLARSGFAASSGDLASPYILQRHMAGHAPLNFTLNGYRAPLVSPRRPGTIVNATRRLFQRSDADPAPPSRPSRISSQDEPATVSEADRLLRELIRTQRTSGAWGEASESVELTAAALVAFARGGHTPRRGDFRRPLRRALDWLKSRAQTPLERLYLLWAHAEIGAMEGDQQAIAQAQSAAATLLANGDPVLAEAITARLAALDHPSRPAGAIAQRNDPRTAAIVADGRATVTADLPLPWRACLTTGRDSAPARLGDTGEHSRR